MTIQTVNCSNIYQEKDMSVYCDSCCDSALEEGELFGIDDPEMILSSMGDLLPDHACDRLEEESIECACNAH